MKQVKRLLALALVLATVCSTLSVTAWASDVAQIDDPDSTTVGSGDPDAPDDEEAPTFVGDGVLDVPEEEDEATDVTPETDVGNGLDRSEAEGDDAQTPETDDDPAAPTKAPAKASSDVYASGTTGSLTWTLYESGKLVISGKGAMPDYSSVDKPWGDYDYYRRIQTVVIESGVTSISVGAFGNCYNLTSVTIPSSVISIGSMAFVSCDSLTSITVASGNQNFSAEDGVLFSKDKTTLICYPAGKSGSYTIPKSVTNIGEFAFRHCLDLTSVTIQNGVTSIGNYAFADCYSLTNVTIPKSVKTIGSFAFYCCTSLTSVTIPESVKTISSYAFYDCTRLTSVAIQSSEAIIEYGAFGYTPWYETQGGFIIANGVLLSYQDNEETVIIPDGVKSIGDEAFFHCTNLTSVTIPNSVKSIGDRAFVNTDLTSVTIPNSVKSIGDRAFALTSLTSVTIPNSVTSIGEDAFFGCTDLTSVTIPSSVTSIGDRAFGYTYNKGEYAKVEGFTISGYTGSAAETYAKKNNITFKALDKPSKLSTPALPTLKTASNGVIINWSKVSGAAKYRVFRKTGNGAWQKLGDTTGTSYTDKTAKAGTTYAYTICCVSADGKTLTSDYNKTGKSVTLYLATPSITTLQSASGGVIINWGKVSGAAKYRVFRRVGSGNWERVADVTDTRAVDRTAKKGVTYTYTVRCISSDSKTYTSDFSKTGKSIKHGTAEPTNLKTPAITNLQSASGGVIINWGKVSGAAKYRVFRRVGNGNWERVADVTDTRAVDRTAKKGTTYTYTVRCISSDSKTYTSDFSKTGKSIKHGTAEPTNLKTPAITNLQNASGGIIINWGKVSGATKYRVFRRVGNGNWERVADVTDTRAVDRTAKKGVTYTYTVRCVTSDGKTYTSSFDSNGKSIKRS